MSHFERRLPARWRSPTAWPLLALALLLAGCGGHHHHDDNSNGPPTQQTPPPAVDAFIAYVQTIVAAVSETAEPAAVDTVQVTTPETTEPAPVP